METRCVKKARFFVVRRSLSFRSKTKRKLLTVLLVLFLWLYSLQLLTSTLLLVCCWLPCRCWCPHCCWRPCCCWHPAIFGIPTVDDDVPAVADVYCCCMAYRIIMFCLPVRTLMCLWEIYIFPGSLCLFCCRKICGPIPGIYKSLTDTWMWKLGLRLRNSPKRKT